MIEPVPTISTAQPSASGGHEKGIHITRTIAEKLQDNHLLPELKKEVTEILG